MRMMVWHLLLGAVLMGCAVPRESGVYLKVDPAPEASLKNAAVPTQESAEDILRSTIAQGRAPSWAPPLTLLSSGRLVIWRIVPGSRMEPLGERGEHLWKFRLVDPNANADDEGGAYVNAESGKVTFLPPISTIGCGGPGPQ